MKLSNKFPAKFIKPRVDTKRPSHNVPKENSMSCSAASSTVRFINNPNDDGPSCPLNKTCFSKKNSLHVPRGALERSGRVINEERKSVDKNNRSQEMRMLSSYRYKAESQKPSRSGSSKSLNHTSFLRFSRFKK